MILDQFGRPYQTAKKPERRPLAAAPILDTWREYVTSGLTPERLATIFKSADAGDVRQQAELFDQMEEKDGHLLGEIGKRRNAVLDIEFKVRPASEETRDVKVAEFVQAFFDNMTDFDDVLVALQDGVGKGFSGLEINWDTSEGQALPQGLEFIEQKRFLFTDTKGYLLRTPMLLTDDNPMGIEIPAWKILFHRYGGKSGHPTRSGLLRVCAWWYLFKNYSVKDWVVFCEVYGMPLRLGKYDQGASADDKDALIAAISSLGSDAAGIISKATEIEFIQGAKGSVSSDLYKHLAQFGNAEISKALLGQTLTAEVGDKGSYAASKTHNEVRLDLAKADTRADAATVRHQLIRPIVGFNFGWDTPIPKYEPVWEEEEDLQAKSEWITSLLEHNVEIPVSFVRKEFNIPEPDGNEPVVGTQRTEDRGPRTEAAKALTAKLESFLKIVAKTNDNRFGQEAVDNLSDQGAKDANEAIAALVQPVLDMIEGAQSFEEIGEKIYGLYPDLDTGEFQELLARAMLAAGLTGYAGAVDDR